MANRASTVPLQVRDLCLECNPGLQVHRARISSITDQEVTQALEQPQQLDVNLANAVTVR